MYKYLLTIAIIPALMGAGCSNWFSSNTASLPAAQPSTMVELQDGETYDLEAAFVAKNINGVSQRMLAYNGMIPGPLIKVKQGSVVTINFTNNTDVESSIHSHGLRLDYRFDGTHLTQKAVQPGETFSYAITFPDSGMFWYHPHFAESYSQELGLYGNYLVVPADEAWSPVNREEALFLDDVALSGGKVSVTEDINHTLMGRYGDTMLVNGTTNYLLQAKKDEVIRFFLTSSANARPFRVSFSGLKMKLIGADGGLYERDTLVDAVILGPSERAIVEVRFPDAGSYDFIHSTPTRSYILGRVNVATEQASPSFIKQFETLSEHTATIASIDPYRKLFAKQPDKRLTLSVKLSGMMMGGAGEHGHMMHGSMMEASSPDGIEWEDTSGMMNTRSNENNVAWELVDQDTGKTDEDISWSFAKGDIIKVRIFNDPDSLHPMQHPIHFHGQRFLVLSRDGKVETNLVWKDTVLIPAGETVDILVEMANPGEWMAHCHISEHLDAGMALTYSVK